MALLYTRWNCIWWNWLNIKTPPSAIYSNMKWFGQMLTSLAMIDSSLTREDAPQVPAAHRSDSNCSSVPVPTAAVWFGHNRWTENFPNEKSPSSSSSSCSPLASGLQGTGRLFYARVSCYQVVALGWLGVQSFWKTVKCILTSFQMLLHICCYWILIILKLFFLGGQEGFV